MDSADLAARRQRMRLSLDGLSVGDAFGERFFEEPALIALRRVPAPPWRWTDDTAMAVEIAAELQAHGRIDQDCLARRFSARFRLEPWRGYGGGAARILDCIERGEAWPEASSRAFNGAGSMGNGGAMRAAPLGAWFADDPERVVFEAKASAAVTHAHPEGQAGAVAAAVAAAVAQSCRGLPRGRSLAGRELLTRAHALTPDGATRKMLAKARELPFDTAVARAASELGSGYQVLASDTVPFALWCAARHLDDFKAALWAGAEGLGDIDTVCAIVGGIVVLAGAEIPPEWLAAREPLPAF